MSLSVAQLWVYPVKSCRGIRVAAAELDALGFVNDRRFLVVDAGGQFLTQRSHPAMAQIEPAINRDHLTLCHAAHGSVTLPLAAAPAPTRTVSVWGDGGLLADDCGSEAAQWLSELLQQPARLVKINSSYRRPVRTSPADEVSFADGYPLLAISEASLDELNDRLVRGGHSPVEMARFRPNLVIAGAPAHAEDGWARLRIGAVNLRGATPCARCTVVTNDPLTGARGPEPLRTLAHYRRDPQRPTDVLFGRNIINETKSGRITTGAPVEVLS